MADAAAPSWDDVVDELVARLPRLRDGDAVAIEIGRYFVQFKQFGRLLLVIASGSGPGTPENARLGPDQARNMAALGWQPSNHMRTHSLPDLPCPMSADTAHRVARLLVATLRDVYGGTTPAAARFSSFNDEGQRAPTLRTVAMSPDQKPETRVVPATLLPAPAPTWQGYLDALLAGVGGWSRPEIEALVARCGGEVTQDDGWRLKAACGALTVSALRADGRGPGFESITARESVPATGSGSRFREALAAAVAVLGDPPLVGGPGPFARWRGTPLTVIVSREQYRHGTARVELTVTPTEVIEEEQYRSGEYDPDWRPDHRWTAWPDTDAPEHQTLTGMMSFPRPPAADLDELGGNLRELFGSFTADLPLLHPYVSSACFRITTPSGKWLVDAVFTHDRAKVRVGNAPSESFPLDGARTGRTVADRVMGALAAAGAGAPDQLRGHVWSATPAEHLDADGLTLPHR